MLQVIPPKFSNNYLRDIATTSTYSFIFSNIYVVKLLNIYGDFEIGYSEKLNLIKISVLSIIYIYSLIIHMIVMHLFNVS